MTTEATGSVTHSPIDGTSATAGELLASQGPRTLLLAAIGLTLIAHGYFVAHQSINWDEFWFLSFVYDYARGTLSVPRQSFHVHLFGWLTSIEGWEIDQIIAARTVYFGLLVGTCTCVYTLARQTASANGALFAVLCCTAYSNLLNHGISFRADGLAVFVLMTALVLLQWRTFRPLALSVSASLVAVALLVTMKSVFFLPVFALVLTFGPPREGHQTRVRREALLFVSVLAIAVIALYLWHRSGVIAPPAKDSVAYLEGIAARAFGLEVLFPGFWYFLDSLLKNPIQWMFLACGFAAAIRGARNQQLSIAWSTIALAIPLVSLVFYRNAFPYFYVFVMPPALVLCGLGLDAWTRNRRGTGRPTFSLVFVVSLIVAGSVTHSLPRFHDTTRAQRTIVQAVHEIFREPVPYIDRNGMIASFPKVGFFMSSWGLQNYHAAGRPIFADVLRTKNPRFVLANSPGLASVFSESPMVGNGQQVLLTEDATLLREHFVHYWGPVYVAGRAMRAIRGTQMMWEVLLPGAYRVLSDAPVTIGGSLYSPGSTVELTSGTVSIHSEITQQIVLRTLSARGMPSYPPPADPIYVEF